MDSSDRSPVLEACASERSFGNGEDCNLCATPSQREALRRKTVLLAENDPEFWVRCHLRNAACKGIRPSM